MKNKKVCVDYKGKHFIIMDEDCVDEFDYIDEYIDLDKVLSNLKSHVEDCIYYGIPAYIGNDEELHKRINEIEKDMI